MAHHQEVGQHPKGMHLGAGGGCMIGFCSTSKGKGLPINHSPCLLHVLQGALQLHAHWVVGVCAGSCVRGVPAKVQGVWGASKAHTSRFKGPSHS